MCISSIGGDIIGSSHESSKKRPFTALFNEKSKFTDDTVLSVATMDAILNKRPYGEVYYEYAVKYPHRGYGGMFKDAIKKGKLEPYNSYGNGSAMRVGPIGFAYDSEKEVLEEAKKSAEVTHSHEDGIRGAQTIAYAIYLLNHDISKEEAGKIIEQKFGYNLQTPLIGFDHSFDVTCQGTIPRCWAIFNDTNSFEEAMRASIELRGDVDTNCCIVGGLCEALYKTPAKEIVKAVYEVIPLEMQEIVTKFTRKYINKDFQPPNTIIPITITNSILSLDI